MFSVMPVTIEFIRAGKLRALAVTTASRSEQLPEVPSVSEFVPGYESEFLVRHRRPEGDACGDRPAAQSGGQCRACRSEDEGTVCRPWRHAAAGLARRLRKVHCRGNRKVGQGGQGLGRQGGIGVLLTDYTARKTGKLSTVARFCRVNASLTLRHASSALQPAISTVMCARWNERRK